MRNMRLTRPRDPDMPRSRFAAADLLSESLAGVLQRPARSALTALGTVLGVGTFVAILGLTATTSSQIDARFNELTATEVNVEDTAGAGDATKGVVTPNAFPPDADARVGALNGVRAAGVYWTVSLQGASVRSAPPGVDATSQQIQVVAASPGVLAAAGPRLKTGRTFDRFAGDRGEQVAVIGSGMAARLGITTLETSPAVFIEGQPFTIIGIIEDVDRKADLLLSVVVPAKAAEEIWGGPGAANRAKMIISTELGAATQVAGEAALALRPDHPEYFKAIPPPDPKALRGNVTSDLNQLFLLLATICLVIGAVGIANTTLVAVLERTGEIGLRRALGARGRHITVQFLAESGALGTLGGLVGTSLGTITVVGVAIARDWTPVIHVGTVAAAPAIGLATGLLAGLYPAWRAASIQPAEALRR
ncbi:ABC transporter permease [Streptomyces sp. CA-243310]|uniref:ABC transporter permease n=1 Tax=Streptomyces sp. CA-243310 TaxID=3240056 RepID=UPI003D9175EE